MSSTQALDLVIFGGAGDLSVRKLLPALFMAHLHNNLPESTRIHALGRQSWDRSSFLRFVQDKVTPFIATELRQGDAWQRFLDRLNYVPLDAASGNEDVERNTSLARRRDKDPPAHTSRWTGVHKNLGFCISSGKEKVLQTVRLSFACNGYKHIDIFGGTWLHVDART